MAKRVEITLVDDLTGEPADETVRFTLNGVHYEIDLTRQNAARFTAAVQEFMQAARRTEPPSGSGRRRGSGTSRPRPSASDRSRTTAIRQWARENGYRVNDRGQIRAEILDAYQRTNN